MKLEDVKQQIDTYFNNISEEEFLEVAQEYGLIEDVENGIDIKKS